MILYLLSLVYVFIFTVSYFRFQFTVLNDLEDMVNFCPSVKVHPLSDCRIAKKNLPTKSNDMNMHGFMYCISAGSTPYNETNRKWVSVPAAFETNTCRPQKSIDGTG